MSGRTTEPPPARAPAEEGGEEEGEEDGGEEDVEGKAMVTRRALEEKQRRKNRRRRVIDAEVKDRTETEGGEFAKKRKLKATPEVTRTCTESREPDDVYVWNVLMGEEER